MSDTARLDQERGVIKAVGEDKGKQSASMVNPKGKVNARANFLGFQGPPEPDENGSDEAALAD
jgi:hypothetical protein